MDDFVKIIVAIVTSGALNILLNYFITKTEKKKDRDSDVRKALRLILKDKLRFLCMHYINQEWIYEDELDDLIAMHKCYHDSLEGNGWLNELMSRVKALEIRGRGIN